MWHVYPTNDLKVHDINGDCACNPIIYIADNGELLYVHNSYDGREHVERLIEIIYCN